MKTRKTKQYLNRQISPEILILTKWLYSSNLIRNLGVGLGDKTVISALKKQRHKDPELETSLGHIHSKTLSQSRESETHACNPSYSGGRE
jgi:hypothetical protein